MLSACQPAFMGVIQNLSLEKHLCLLNALLYVNLSLVGPFATLKIIWKFKIWRETPKAENYMLGKSFILMESKK